MAQKKKKSGAKAQPRKKNIAKPLIFGGIAALIIVAVIIALVAVNSNSGGFTADLKNSAWKSVSARNASDDEVDIREVYNVKYSNYQGTLSFDGENGFELWLSPGLSDDGTHTGKYTVEGNTVKAVYDSGEKSEFVLTGKDNKISSIELKYGDYTVTFVKE